MTNDNDYFVPNATYGGRQDTATALVGAADEHGVSQREVRAGQGGFWISEALAEKLFNDVDESALSEADLASHGDDGTATVDPADADADDADADQSDQSDDADDADADKSEQSDDQTPEGDPSSEEQTDKAPAKKSRSKK